MRSPWWRATSRRSEGGRRGGAAVPVLLAAAFLGLDCSDTYGPEQDALAEARARWRVAGIDSYEYELQRSCFCGPDVLRPVRIVVTDGSVTSAVYADTGEPLGTPLAEVPVIEDLFDEVQDAIEREAFWIEASYDAELGYPTSVSIDYEEFTADEEMAFTVSQLSQPAQSGARSPK